MEMLLVVLEAVVVAVGFAVRPKRDDSIWSF